MGAGTALVACVGPPRQYTLKIDVANQDNTRLCYRDTGSSANVAATCEPFAAQPLHTPSTLTVTLDKQASGIKYDLRVAQFSREASKADAQAILEGFTARVEAMVEAVGASKIEASKLLSDAAALARSQAPKVADVIASKLAAPEAASRGGLPARIPGAVFPLVNGKLQTADELRANQPLTATNAPERPPVPFPRAVSLDDADLKALPVSVTVEDVARSIAEWCSADSFLQTADRPRWVKVYAALETDPDVQAVSERLAPSAGDVVQYLLGQGASDPLASVIEPLLDAGKAWASAPDSQANAAARAFYLMRLAKTVQRNLQNCEANIKLLKARDVKKTDLDAVARSTTKLRDAAARWAKAFDDLFRPLLQRAVVAAEQTLDLSGGSTTLTLEPGQLELGVGMTPSGGTRAEIATYKVKTSGIERLAVLIAPTLTWCTWGCFDRFDQVAQLPMTAGAPAHPVIDRTELSYNLSIVTALHVTVYSWDNLGVGAVLGYPIGTPRETTSNFVVGLGLRHESGVELSVGLHAMLSKALKSQYSTPLDLGTPGYENLTVDSVTTDVPKFGVFVLLGFAPGVLTALNK